VFPAAKAAAFSLIPQADLASQPLVHGQVARLAHRDRAARQPAPLPATQ
jgi:hypothetical protein